MHIVHRITCRNHSPVLSSPTITSLCEEMSFCRSLCSSIWSLIWCSTRLTAFRLFRFFSVEVSHEMNLFRSRWKLSALLAASCSLPCLSRARELMLSQRAFRVARSWFSPCTWSGGDFSSRSPPRDNRLSTLGSAFSSSVKISWKDHLGESHLELL